MAKPVARPAPACVPIIVTLIAAVAATALGLPLPTAPTAYGKDLRAYAGQVSWRLVHNEGNTTLVCRGEGSAVFLGGNRFPSAAHVANQNPFTNDCAEFGSADPAQTIVILVPSEGAPSGPDDE